MNFDNTSKPRSRTFDKNEVDYAGAINKVHLKNVSQVTLTNTREFPSCMRQKTLVNPIPNMLNMKLTRTYPNQFEEESTPRRPQNNHYPIPKDEILTQRPIVPVITH